VQPDGKLASQQTGEVFVDCGAAPFDFDKKNDLNNAGNAAIRNAAP
jgi:hypothetical protein